jgi:dTDP-4-dehydrorhamnose reductase
MKHLILGAGNLGKDLLLELNKIEGACPEILSQSRGVGFNDYCVLFEEIRKRKPSYIWVAVGGGSVPEAKLGTETHPRSRYLNEILPGTLNEDVPESCKVIFFSTDYVADEENPSDPKQHATAFKSEYAKQKFNMERWILGQNKKNRAIVRVTSLYGVHKPEKTFPGKVLKNFVDPNKKIHFPQNKVTPTPTRWLASVLSQNVDKLFNESGSSIHHCAPKGNLPVREWAMLVLEGVRDKKDFMRVYDSPIQVDIERPYTSNLGCSFADVHHYLELWNVYFKREWFQKSHIPSAEVLKTVDFSVKL